MPEKKRKSATAKTSSKRPIARAAIVEKCAKICDELAAEFRNKWKEEMHALAAEACASRIRDELN